MARNKDVAPVRARVIDDALLLRAQELNRDYVELLSLPPAPTDAEVEMLPERLVYELTELPAAARMRLTATPFALYSLGFEDQLLWRFILEDGRVAERDPPPQERYATFSSASTAFCEVALFFAWHAAVANRVAARMLFAMPDTLAERIVRTPLWRMRRIAAEFPGLLVPRWPTNPRFWPDLLRFAKAGDWPRLEMTQLLGSQLTAAELDMAHEEDASGMRRRSRHLEARMRKRRLE